MNIQLPVGVSDSLPSSTEKLNQIKQKIAEFYTNNNYKFVKTPYLEQYESIAPFMGDHLKSSCIKFIDESGDVIMLKPDNTLPIARLVSTRMKNEPLPLTLAYTDTIFRKPKSEVEDKEILQSGIECIGNDVKDIDVILSLINLLNYLNITDFVIQIGHTDFTKHFDPETHQSIQNGDFIQHGEIPKITDSITQNEHRELHNIYLELNKKDIANHIQFNLGLIKDLSYYTGICFDVYSPNINGPIASGGRYDSLLSQFGIDEPAIGFALNVTKLLKVFT